MPNLPQDNKEPLPPIPAQSTELKMWNGGTPSPNDMNTVKGSLVKRK